MSQASILLADNSSGAFYRLLALGSDPTMLFAPAVTLPEASARFH
jgi:hypothetical protein